MSNSDYSENKLFQEDLDPGSDVQPEVASTSSSYRRTSTRLASRSGPRTAEADLLTSQLQQQGISPAPGLPLSQGRELLDQVSVVVPQPMPAAPAGSPGRPARERGRGCGGKRKRKRKSGPPGAHPSKQKTSSPARPNVYQTVSTLSQPPIDNSLANTLQSLANSMQIIDARLQSLERASAGASTSSTTRAAHSAMALPGFMPDQAPTFPHTEASPHSLASAIPAPPSGRPYIPQAANIPPRLRSKILEGNDINLVSLILPSPECDKSIATGGSITAVFKSSDPRLNRDLSIGQFLVAFSIYRDVICSVYPERRQELDAYLALIGDLNLKHGKNVFYTYHKSFSSKAALHIAHSNIRLDWSILDTELLVMSTGGHQVIPCNSCGAPGHLSPFCPSVPLSAFRAPSAFQTLNDREGRQVQRWQEKQICNNFNENVCTYSACNFLHICSFCKDSHPRSVCPRRSSRPKITALIQKPHGGKTF